MVGDGRLRHGKTVAERLVGALQRRADRLEHGEPPRIGERLRDALELSGGELGRRGWRIHGFMTIELRVGGQIRGRSEKCPAFGSNDGTRSGTRRTAGPRRSDLCAAASIKNRVRADGGLGGLADRWSGEIFRRNPKAFGSASTALAPRGRIRCIRSIRLSVSPPFLMRFKEKRPRYSPAPALQESDPIPLAGRASGCAS